MLSDHGPAASTALALLLTVEKRGVCVAFHGHELLELIAFLYTLNAQFSVALTTALSPRHFNFWPACALHGQSYTMRSVIRSLHSFYRGPMRNCNQIPFREILPRRAYAFEPLQLLLIAIAFHYCPFRLLCLVS